MIGLGGMWTPQGCWILRPVAIYVVDYFHAEFRDVHGVPSKLRERSTSAWDPGYRALSVDVDGN